jgi:hypothetical protein
MTPDVAVQRPAELYGAMTGEQRLKLAIDLHEFACNVASEGVRHRYPRLFLLPAV